MQFIIIIVTEWEICHWCFSWKKNNKIIFQCSGTECWHKERWINNKVTVIWGQQSLKRDLLIACISAINCVHSWKVPAQQGCQRICWVVSQNVLESGRQSHFVLISLHHWWFANLLLCITFCQEYSICGRLSNP